MAQACNPSNLESGVINSKLAWVTVSSISLDKLIDVAETMSDATIYSVESLLFSLIFRDLLKGKK